MHALAALAAALALPALTPIAGEPGGGQVLSVRIPETPRATLVYLPPGYDPAQRYPVVYLLHGLPGEPTEYVDGMQLAQFATAGIRSGRIRPFIAVMPTAGPTSRYDGEWAGIWSRKLLQAVVPWVDRNLPTIAAPTGRIVAGLSAGGYGAIDVALRHPGVFGTAECWSGYFTPLRDGPFEHAGPATLAANDPVLLAPAEASALRAAGLRFFLSTGPFHSHWIDPADTLAFARELRSLRLRVEYLDYPRTRGEWRAQLDAGLRWALAAPR